MIQSFFILLLLLFLAGFLGLEYVEEISILGVPLIGTATSVGIARDTLKAIAGMGLVFCEFVVILLSMLDRIGDTLRDVVKPLIRLVPFGLFITSIWEAFSPIAFNLLPANVAESVGVARTGASIAETVQTGNFTESILLSLAMMLLFVIATYALGVQKESVEIKQLRAENARLKRKLDRGV